MEFLIVRRHLNVRNSGTDHILDGGGIEVENGCHHINRDSLHQNSRFIRLSITYKIGKTVMLGRRTNALPFKKIVDITF